MNLIIRKYRDGDTINLRPLDERGVQVCGVEPKDALSLSVALSHEHFVYEVDGEVVAAWGYASHGFASSRVYGWLLTSPAVEQYPTRFLRASRRAVDRVLQLFPTMEVSPLKEHRISQMWLTWLGFKFVGETDLAYVLERTR